MRIRAKVDGNQAEIVARFRAHSWSCKSTATIGGGFPDVLVSSVTGRTTFLVEIKMPREILNALQLKWHAEWNGRIETVRTVDDVDDLVKQVCERELKEMGRG